jgi:hypothetical protein
VLFHILRIRIYISLILSVINYPTTFLISNIPSNRINSHSAGLLINTLLFIGWIPFPYCLIHFLNFPLSSDLFFIVAEEGATAEVACDDAVVAGHLDDAVGVGAAPAVAAQSEVVQTLAALEVDRVGQVLRQVAW